MFLLIISLLALSIFLFSMDLSWSNVVSANRNDLVFEGRNTDYGAFALRREHHMNLFYALLLSVGLIGGGFLAISALRSKPVQNVFKELPGVLITIDPPKPFDKKPDVENKVKPPVKPAVAAAAGSTGSEVEVVEKTPEVTKPVDPVTPPGDPSGTGTGPIAPADPVGGSGTGPGTGGDGSDTPKKKARRIVKNRPEFPGGEKALMQFMADHVDYSEIDINRGVSGTIYITFTVNEDGSVNEIILERGIRNGENLARKAIKAISEMPRWTPGNDGAEPLPVLVTMPVKFELRN